MKHQMHNERGFSIIEVLIVTLLTVVITGIALTTFVDASKTATKATALSDVNHNLRVAMNILMRDLLQTGGDIPTGGIPMPQGGAATEIGRPGPIGAELTFPPEWETMPAVTPGPGLGPIINGVATDLLTMVRVDPSLPLSTEAVPFVQAINANGSSITINAAIPIDDDVAGIKPGDLIMFSNGNGYALQEVTSVVGQTILFDGTAESQLNQPTAPDGSVVELGNPDGTWPQTTVKRILMLTYYLVDSSNGGSEVPALVRRTNYGPERLLATGIEDLQLSWDLVDDNENPINIEFPEPPNSPHQIRKANLYMAARSIDKAPNGQLLRAALNTQVSLRSLAFVNRYK